LNLQPASRTSVPTFAFASRFAKSAISIGISSLGTMKKLWLHEIPAGTMLAAGSEQC